ncbi:MULTISPECIES: M3 family oligoendopeptidase [Kosmotoga]|uniref:Oligoendopeptidase, M3 family n=1 Tax=Kosmotoga olearia (strain ATCC BAA-1733 / DSM 21960 / TBF 19.5.1) TaxID=521045 RepID=C5CDV8_KOSOT|nr:MULTISPECIES: M3 family oligoendopeptidase [Kosmotoga]ACR79127.1 oligoendopeptidase, M3 family [Kosmotoga olearia TBF 19.5.1]MDI3523607.1 oligoendopeptidase [Kosmotoga sp.]MDK2953145.1 oligoendopeptidase [Kosmotoga sp.]OAA23821.1 oligoendopeptidase F [Kosmotoga sp. DU53]
MLYTQEKITKKPRKYFTEDLDVIDWKIVEREFKGILEQEISSADDLVKMMEKFSELMNIIGEENAWRYIRMTRFADKNEYREAYNDFLSNIVLRSEPYQMKIAKRFYESPYRSQLDSERYENLDRIIANKIEMFKEENLPLKAREAKLASKYGAIIGSITVKFKGEEKTLQQLGAYQLDPDRNTRENSWRLRMQKILEHSVELDKLFDDLKEIRVQQAKNAGFDNYRDYKHKEKGRFAYTPDELFEFHESVEKVVVPFVTELNEKKRNKLNLDSLRPWDTSVDPDGKVLKPFKTIDEFVEKAIRILYKVKPEFGVNLNKMCNSGLLDLENRKGKAPGGYNYSLAETGAPFIFMNAVGTEDNVRTILHESGHAMHSFAMANEPIHFYRRPPMEASELASMSMELLTLDHWDEYFPNEEEYIHAKRRELEGTVKFLPWCMIVDAFQHWIYTNPEHTPEERTEYFKKLMDRFNTGVDWSDLDKEKGVVWMQQLHIFTSPFYYIEYGIAQLGAIAIYRNYRRKGKRAIEDYEKFLKLGYSKPLEELYKTAGIKFDFSQDYIGELVEFIEEELKQLS